MKLKVTIMDKDSPIYALQKALVITRTPALLGSVVEIYIGKTKMSHFVGRSQMIYKAPYLLFPAIFTLVKAIPAMQQLHTIRLAYMSVSRTELYSILSSPCLIHLILYRVQIPKLNTFPPPTLRKLTLSAITSWEGVEPLIGHLQTSLEYFELRWCKFRALRPLLFRPFPRLRELRHGQNGLRGTFPNESRMSELFQLGSQITHLYLFGSFDHIRVTALPKCLRHLSIEARVLIEQNFRTSPLRGLLSLSIKGSTAPWEYGYPLRLLPSLIRDCFPGITSLQLHIQWSFRNIALVLARFQRNVRVLKLVIETSYGIDHKRLEPMPGPPRDDITIAYLSTSQASLQSLRLDVTQKYHELERSIAPCTRWIENDTLPSVTGVGGPDLKSVDALFIQPESRLVQERVVRRQWAKSNEGDWEINKCL